MGTQAFSKLLKSCAEISGGKTMGLSSVEPSAFDPCGNANMEANTPSSPAGSAYPGTLNNVFSAWPRCHQYGSYLVALR